jgi:predicted transcriptional regulator
MADEPPSTSINRELTSTIVVAYVRQNQIGSDQLGMLISTVHQALSGLGRPAAEIETERTPAVPIRRSVHRDHVVCLECGWRGQTLRRHLSSRHGLSVDQYRARWNLSREHPLTAPSYSERRSGLAKELGLGRGRRASPEEPGRARNPGSTSIPTSTARKAAIYCDTLTKPEPVLMSTAHRIVANEVGCHRVYPAGGD